MAREKELRRSLAVFSDWNSYEVDGFNRSSNSLL